VEMYNSVEANFLPYSLWDVTASNAEALRTQVNYKMIVGDADSQYQSNIRFRDRLIALGIDPQFRVLPGVEHLGGSYLIEGSGLRFLSEHFAASFAREGDYDRDGDIDANDYGVWKAAFASVAQLPADGNENGVIDAADYIIWRKHMSVMNSAAADLAAASFLAAAVPEPAALALAVLGMLRLLASARSPSTGSLATRRPI
jgi:hypothetical protein